jgi:hypothetical protein
VTRPAAALALLLAAPPALAWGSLQGNGRKTTEARSVPPFTAVRLEGSLDVEVKVGPDQAVNVTIDSNLQPEVETRVDGETLVIAVRRGVSFRGPGKLQLSLPVLTAVELRGSGDVAVDGTAGGAGGGDLRLGLAGSGDLRWRGGAARALQVELAGSGDLQLAGTAESLQVSLDGSGDVQADGLSARSAKVRVDGSGDVELRLAGGALDAEVAGSGSVRWAGEARVERASVAGSGEISRR